MRKPYCFNLLVSSPNDVDSQRDIIEKICLHWNRTIGQEKDVIIEVQSWGKNLQIDSREKFQPLINSQLVKNCDILFAIFGRRFGTKTDSFGSGTEDEIEQIIKSGKPYFIYFMNQNLSIDEAGKIQIQKLRSFKSRLKESKKSYRDIKDDEDLNEKFFSDVSFHITNLLEEIKKDSDKKNLSDPAISVNKNEVNLLRSKENWYELSISVLINKYLQDNNQHYAFYRRGITFNENCHLWKSLPTNHLSVLSMAKAAREFAFNSKYGNYDYGKDLRSKYPNWYDEILNVLSSFKNTKSLNVIGVASNCGIELNQIFSKAGFKTPNLEVLDLSDDAIKKGKKLYPQITFTKGDMEESSLEHLHYDVYLNLRSIHSSGVDYKLALTDCHRILKPGGIAIISVSNGYLTPKKPNSKEYFEVSGLYDNRTENFSKHRPNQLARKIWSKLVDYNFTNVCITTGKTEIFITAKKLE